MCVHTIRTRLSKLARVNPAIDDALGALPKDSFASSSDPKSPLVKATNRILASKAAVDEWKDVLYLVKQKAGLEVTGERPRYLKKQSASSQKTSATASAASKAATKPRAQAEEENVDDQESEEDRDSAAASAEEEAEIDDDEVARELAQFSEDSDPGTNSEDDDGSAIGAPEDEEEEQPLEQEQSRKAFQREQLRRPAKKQRLDTSSTFLPSLATGYVSFSDDDDDDARWIRQAEHEDRQQERKNRPGQRARRALWEKKFGEKAKHVVKARKQDPKASASSSLAVSSNLRGAKLLEHQKEVAMQERAAREAERKRAYQERQQRANGRREGPANANMVQMSDKRAKKADSAPVHPSWEAKRKAQEALQAAPAGKKIKFD